MCVCVCVCVRERERERERERQTETETDRQTDRQTHRQTDQTDQTRQQAREENEILPQISRVMQTITPQGPYDPMAVPADCLINACCVFGAHAVTEVNVPVMCMYI